MVKDIEQTLTSKIIFVLLAVCIVFTALAYGTVHQPTIALFYLLAAALNFLDSASRLRKMTSLITIFGFAFAFFAILQAVLSPTKIYGIYEVEYAKPFGSFVNRHNFAAYIEMAIAIPLGLLFAGAVQRDKRLI